MKDDRFSFLADVMGVGGVGGLVFDEDDVLANNDDEDLKKDPVSQIDLRVSGFLPPDRFCYFLFILVGTCHFVYS